MSLRKSCVVDPVSALLCDRDKLASYNALRVLDFVHLSPRSHDKSIVRGYEGDNVDALLLDLVDVLDVRWEVVGLAAGCEGTLNASVFLYGNLKQ